MKATFNLIVIVFTILLFTGCASNKHQTLRGMTFKKVEVAESNVEKVDTRKVMKRYRQFLDDAPVNSPLYSEALNRLADLEMLEGDKKVFVDQEQQYADAVEAMSEGGKPNSQTNYQNAIDLYESLLAANPNDRRSDWVMYQLSRAYEQSGKIEGAIVTLQRLIKTHPASQYVPESRFRLAELLYGQRQFVDAEAAYRKVLELGRRSPFYDKSVYKLGWSLFKQERYQPALDQFFVALHLLPIVYGEDDRVQTTGLTQLEKDLLIDIFRAINLSFSYINGPKSLQAYFKRNPDPRLEFEVFMRLGEFYLAADRVEDAAETFGFYVDHHGTTPQAAQMQLLKVDAYTKGGFVLLSLNAREEFVQNFAAKQSFWDSLSQQQRRVHGKRVKDILVDLSSYYHARAQKSHRQSDYQVAVRWYDILVRMFPGEETLEQHLLLAEILYQLRNYPEAIKHFEYIAYDLPQHERSVDAAYSALLAHEKLIAAAGRQQRDAQYGEYVKSAFRFLSWFPSDKRTLDVRVTTAERLFALKRYDEAVVQAKNIVQHEEKLSSRNFVAAYLIMGHVAFDKQDYVSAADSYEKVLLKKVNSKQRLEINKKYSVAKFKIAEGLREKGELVAAAKVFEETASQTQNIEIQEKATFDAASVYYNQGEWSQALPLLEKFVANHPKSQFIHSAKEQLVVVYQSLDRPLDAAETMKWLAEREKDVTKKRELLWTVAGIYKSKNKLNSAAAEYDEFYRSFKVKDAQALEAMYEIALIKHRKKNIKSRDHWYRQIIKVADSPNLKSELRARTIAAEASFMLAEEQFSRYSQVKLSLPLKRSLKRKKRAMNAALKAYEKVVSYSVAEYSTASTHRVAEIYSKLGEAVMQSTRPKGLNAEEKEMYSLQLEEQAFPFEEKAIEIYESNAVRVKDGLYDDWVKKSLAALSKLQPIRYAKDEQVELAFENIF